VTTVEALLFLANRVSRQFLLMVD